MHNMFLSYISFIYFVISKQTIILKLCQILKYYSDNTVFSLKNHKLNFSRDLLMVYNEITNYFRVTII